MPATQEIFGLAAGAVSLLSYLIYIVSIVRGQTRPSHSTWWILSFANAIILASSYATGSRETLWIPLSYFAGSLIVSILSLRYGEGRKWSSLDKTCFVTCLISVSAWTLTGSALVALIINICIDLMGMIPTIVKSYSRPISEDSLAWQLTFAGSILNLFAIREWDFATSVYPLYLFVANGLMTYLLMRKKTR